MGKITISVPDTMSEYVRTRIESGQYGNVSEFFRDLVRKDQERQLNAIRELNDMMDRAEASGRSSKTADQVLGEARDAARAQGLLDE